MGMKSVRRLMEKISRSYQGHPERVTDIVRSTIVCEAVEDVRRVLQFALENAHIHIIKNRFDLNYSGDDTGGYRDLNVQLSFPELKGTAFDGFVFELQIHLEDILQRKHAEGHKRYVALRN